MEVELANGVKRIGPQLVCAAKNQVIFKRFFPSSIAVADRIAAAALSYTETDIETMLQRIDDGWGHRHHNVKSFLRARFDEIVSRLQTTAVPNDISDSRKMVIASYFVHEYAIQSAALFNPSIVAFKHSTDKVEGDGSSLEVVVSLRAVGEGHISSIVFRTGVLTPDHRLELDPELLSHPLDTGVVTTPAEGASALWWNPVTGHEFVVGNTDDYTVTFPAATPLSRRVLFPSMPNQSNGIEDARFVRFEEDGEPVRYFATFTAYDGKSIAPQMLETQDFLSFRTRALKGAIENKGMALFPRKIGGRYWMLSRQDDVNVLVMHSDSLLSWSNPVVLLSPEQPWEMFKMGNCGAPIETPKGWVVLTHGVGPLRRYCIGAALLDLEDPTKVIARLKDPIIAPLEEEREGYVPNVVYSCGGLLHNGTDVIIPYAMSDSQSNFASIPLSKLFPTIF